MSAESPVSLAVVQHALRYNLPFICIASIVFAAGIVSIVLSRLRLRDRLLLWLGFFALLYGARLLVENDLISRAITTSDDHPFRLVAPTLTFLISIPYALFARELLGPGWKNSLSIWVWVEAAFAAIAIPIAIVNGQLNELGYANSVLVVTGTLLMIAHLIRPGKPDSAAEGLKWPLIFCAILVVLTNLRYRPAGVNIEPFGFLVLLCGLGYTALKRALSRERKLTEVEQELATARRIQNSILPRDVPQLSSLRLAVRYQPMTSVAGDFYDFLQTGEQALTILVADVSGHGVPAALVASMLKICFAAQRSQAADPAKVLAGLNAMLKDVLTGQYVTAACAAVDLSAETLTYAGAGHPPALLLRQGGTDLVELAENGLFIGPFPQASYQSICVPFTSGDSLLLYTDGITEAVVDDGEQFGRERLGKLLIKNRSLPPDQLVGHVLDSVTTAAQEDDLTVVLAKVQ